MAATIEFRLPDIGDFKDVDVVEVLVSTGDRVEAEQPLAVLESDKATMEVPSPAAGRVKELRVKVGDQVLFGKYSGTEVKVEGEDLLVMREDDIMAVIES